MASLTSSPWWGRSWYRNGSHLAVGDGATLVGPGARDCARRTQEGQTDAEIAQPHSAHGIPMTIALWIVQGSLAVFFLWHAVMKFVLPEGLPDTLVWLYDIPRLPSIGIGILELMAAIGLVLPGVTRIRPQLVPLAAGGLMLTMVGAAIFHATRGEFMQIPVNLVVFVLAGFVAYGRARLRPIAERA